MNCDKHKLDRFLKVCWDCAKCTYTCKHVVSTVMLCLIARCHFVSTFILPSYINALSNMYLCDKLMDDIYRYWYLYINYECIMLLTLLNLWCNGYTVQTGRVSVASVYAPVTYMPCPLLLFRKDVNTGALVMVATGSLTSVDPDRIVLKRVRTVLYCTWEIEYYTALYYYYTEWYYYCIILLWIYIEKYISPYTRSICDCYLYEILFYFILLMC